MRFRRAAACRPAERTLGDPTKFDYLVVVGGVMDDLTGLGAAYVSYLTRAAAAGVPLIGLCTGASFCTRQG